MRSFIAISPRTPIIIASLLTLAACDDDSVAPPDYDRSVGDYGNMAGSYEGTVQGPGGSVSHAGEAALTVNQTGDSISGEMMLDAQFTEGAETISVEFNFTYTGVVIQESAYPNVALLLENAVCGGTTEFTGTYTTDDLSFVLLGEYVLKEGDDCTPVTTLDLAVSVQKTTE